jgi:ActR/RegA family two-component response regulator
MTEAPKERILLVDDDKNLLDAMRRQMRNKLALDTATSAAEGLLLIKKSGPYAVIISDMQMPVCNGLQFLAKAKDFAPHSVRLMLTGNLDQDTATNAINHAQIFRFLKKPCELDTFESEINNALAFYKLQMGEKELLEKTLIGSVSVLVDIITAAHPDEFKLAQRVREELNEVCKALNYECTWTATMAALLLPIGKLITISEHNDAVTSPAITEKSAALLRKIPRLASVTSIITGIAVPYGKSHEVTGDEELPLASRLLRILYDQMALEASGTPRSLALRKLMNTSGVYDIQMLEQLAGYYAPHIVHYATPRTPSPVRPRMGQQGEQSINQKPQHQSMSIMISVAELMVGDELMDEMVALDGSRLLDPGHIITESILNRLKDIINTRGIREPVCVKVTAADLGAPPKAA